MIYKVGDMIPLWITPRKILKILPYHGKYKEFFNCTLQIELPTCRRGYIEMAHKQE
jgi:hypothetical protein